MAASDSPEKEDIDLFPVLVTEFLAISIINVITITAFARHRHLRKRSTYLVMNLTVADLLVDVVTGPLFMFYHQENENDNKVCTWPGSIICAIQLTFPIASEVNLSLISLERLHATLFPVRHCLITRCVYFKMIIACWFTAFTLAFVILLSQEALPYAWASFSAVTLLVLAVSYIIIIVNVQSNPHSQHGGSIHKERKLSVTLFIVTGVSVLTILPMAIFSSMPVDVKKKWRSASSVHVHHILIVIHIANSIVNPLVYAIRMREFRKALNNLVSGKRQAAQKRQRKAEQERAPRSQPETKWWTPNKRLFMPRPCWVEVDAFQQVNDVWKPNNWSCFHYLVDCIKNLFLKVESSDKTVVIRIRIAYLNKILHSDWFTKWGI